MSTINALDEFRETLGPDNLLCAVIGYFDHSNGGESIVLKMGYSETDLFEFYGKLDFSYPADEALLMITGNIWLKDGGWYERDYTLVPGAEWWERHHCPKIPADCQP